MSMAHSLEVRVPYLDPEIVKIALSLPDLTKIDFSNNLLDSYTSSYRDLGTKKILIDVAKKYLPKDFDLQPKRGFGMPFDFWLRNNIGNLVEEAFSEESIIKRGIFSVKGLRNLYSNFLEGKASWAQIWLITVIEFWFRENLDN
jgi:asparagine synthase (glutamine-hydrolysing)